jgi:predicted dehydrogenase
MGRWHAAAIASAGGALVAVVDPSLERARALGGRTDVFASLEELAGRVPRIDIVHVCTPLGTHAELAQRAMELDAHVVVEKPLAPDASMTSALLSEATARGLVVVPVHQFLFQPGVQRLVAERERFGRLVRCLFETTTAGADVTGADPDRIVEEILPHPLALFSRFTPVPLSDLEWLAVRPAPGELRALAHSSGTTFEIVISTRGRPTRAKLELVGTRGSAQADLYHGFAVIERGAPTRARKAARPFFLAGATLAHAGGNLATRAARRETAYPGLRELVRMTYQAIRSGSPPPIDPEETLAVALASDAIRGATSG